MRARQEQSLGQEVGEVTPSILPMTRLTCGGACDTGARHCNGSMTASVTMTVPVTVQGACEFLVNFFVLEFFFPRVGRLISSSIDHGSEIPSFEPKSHSVLPQTAWFTCSLLPCRLRPCSGQDTVHLDGHSLDLATTSIGGACYSSQDLKPALV